MTNQIQKRAGSSVSLKDNAPDILKKAVELMQKSERFKLYPEFDPEIWDPIVKALNSIAFDMGQRTQLHPEESKRLCDHLHKYFKDINLEELQEAFGMYQAQQLDFKDGYYQSFDKLFLGNVLSSFMRYRLVSLSDLEQFKESNAKPNKTFLEYLELHLFKPYNEIKEGAEYYFPDHIANAMYTRLDQQGLAKMSTADKKRLKDEVEKEMLAEKDNIGRIDDYQLKFYCRVKAFKEWIMEKVMEEYDLETEIKKLL